MSSDWQWKLEEAVKRIQERYDYVGSKTGAAFMAVVYPPEAETAVYKEWQVQLERLGPEYDVQAIDVLALTMAAVAGLGSQNIVTAMADPMPGSNPEADLGRTWIAAVTQAIHDCLDNSAKGRPVAVLHNVAALYPVTGPRALLQALWDNPRPLNGPVIIFIPGKLVAAREYTFPNKVTEVMYRGDIL